MIERLPPNSLFCDSLSFRREIILTSSISKCPNIATVKRDSVKHQRCSPLTRLLDARFRWFLCSYNTLAGLFQ